MILADIYDLLNDVFFEVLRFIIMAAVIVLAVFIGSRLRIHHDNKKKNNTDSGTLANESDSTDESVQ